MDPDAALRLMLDPTTPPEEVIEARRGLRKWLLAGGFPPSESVVREAGLTRGLTSGRFDDRVSILPYEDGWVLMIPSSHGCPPTPILYRLRREKEK